MASFNNKHWPSMFRSKHAGGHPWDAPQPDVSGSPPSFLSGGSTTTTGCSLKHPSSGGEERSPDPKPRWNPKPEQIRILEAIFNSGMVNPPREEIPRIRMRLQQYGPVGDANVFYWFQNRKSRSKNKLRAATACTGGGRAIPVRSRPAREAAAAAAAAVTSPPLQPQRQPVQLLASPARAPTSSSSSSSDRSSGSSKPAVKPAAAEPMSATAMDLIGPLAAACQQMYYQGHPVAPAPKVQETVSADEPTFLQWPQGYCLSAAELAAILGAQYMHVPVHQQQTPALPAGMFLGLSNDVAAPAITSGHRSCAGWGAGLGQYWPAAGADHHLVLDKNTAALNTAAAAREVEHDDATKLRLLQYGFGVSTAVGGASAAATLPLAALSSPNDGVTVASAALPPAAGLAGLPASTAANGVADNYDHQFQGLAEGAGVRVATTAGGAGTAAAEEAAGVAVLCITDGTTGASAVHSDVPATRLDVRTLFGEAAVLFRHAAGDRIENVPVDASSGVTVEPLQHGGVYHVLI
ncbi:hypothetical protein ACP70R_037040 [Stipagrostis hirtigluma subsp. patula]